MLTIHRAAHNNCIIIIIIIIITDIYHLYGASLKNAAKAPSQLLQSVASVMKNVFSRLRNTYYNLSICFYILSVTATKVTDVPPTYLQNRRRELLTHTSMS